MAATTRTKDYLGRPLMNPGTAARDFLGRVIEDPVDNPDASDGDEVDFLGRALLA